MSFAKKKYQIIRQAISKELADIGYNYLQISAEADHWMLQNGVTHEKNPLIGNFKDTQVPGSYAKYADRLMETLLIKTIPVMKAKTGLDLIPTYSYTRLYRTGNILNRHKDRPSCEISTTLFLGGDKWPIYLEPSGEVGKKGTKINLNPGDMLVYKGCELEHWREKFEGEDCAQVFLHYNRDTEENQKNIYDSRPHIGLPSFFRRDGV